MRTRLVANKCDLPERPIPKEDIQQLCDEQGFIGWIETSAKEDVNVSKAMRYFIFTRHPPHPPSRPHQRTKYLTISFVSMLIIRGIII